MFIYVFSTQDKDKLLANGYYLLKEDPGNSKYIFVAKDNQWEKGSYELFSSLDLFFTTDVLTF